MEINPLIPIGKTIKVDKSKIENLIPNKLLDSLPQMINAEIVDYKMTDGMDIGYVLKTENNLKIWIFTTELNEQTRKEYRIEDESKYIKKQGNSFIFGKFKVTYEMNGNRNLDAIASPINLIKWLIFTLKDVF
tara:strand:- start:126 stop:524 length:399 start_codon:yes stop_codon:yes gene_type:complete